MVVQASRTQHVLKPLTFKPLLPDSVPKLPASWPPAGFREAVNVSRGNWTWETVAGRYAVKDVRNLIYFNFETTNPKEVNWFLMHYIGCYQSEDGLNFMFEGAEPGTVYIPPIGYQRQTPTFSPFERYVVTTIRQYLPYFRDCSYKGVRVRKTDLIKVLRDIETGAFNVYYDPSLSDRHHAGEYLPDQKAILLKYWDLRSVHRENVLLHEFVHILVHRGHARRSGRPKSNRPFRNMDNEFMAFTCSTLANYAINPDYMEAKLQKAALGGRKHARLFLAHLVNQDSASGHVLLDAYDRQYNVADYPPMHGHLLKTFNPVRYLKRRIAQTYDRSYLMSEL